MTTPWFSSLFFKKGRVILMDLHKLRYLLIFGFFSCVVIGSMADKAQSQEVSTGKQVSIEYTLKLEDKSVVDSNVGAEPLTFIQGSHNIIPGLENALNGMKIGNRKHGSIKPEDAYGPVDKDAVSEIKKDQIPQNALKVGAVLQGQNPDGQVIIARVVEIKEDTVLLDYNHPLAGKTLFFDVKILDVQDAPKPTS
jgi:FKBP-type peptidyl-prolyl cis-trans isomerase SlyD